MTPGAERHGGGGHDPRGRQAVELVGNASRMPFIAAQLEAFFGHDLLAHAQRVGVRGARVRAAGRDASRPVQGARLRGGGLVPVPRGVLLEHRGGRGEGHGAVRAQQRRAVAQDDYVFPQRDLRRRRPSTPRRRCCRPTRSRTIGAFEIGPVPQCKEPEGKTKLKVAIRLNLNGLVSVESAQAVEEIEEEVTCAGARAPAEGEEPPEGEPMETTKMVKKTIRTDVPVVQRGGRPARAGPGDVRAGGVRHGAAGPRDGGDEGAQERRRGVRVLDALEGCRRVGALRRAGGRRSSSKLLNDTEDWLYDEGEDETKGCTSRSSRS